MQHVTSYTEFSDIISSSEAVLLYVSSPGCSVCHALLPQVKVLMQEFPRVTMVYANTGIAPDIAGQLTVFSVPAVLFFLKGKEQFRAVRFVPIGGLRESIGDALKII
ncbi:thioredoxin family protein [Domibacillus sp. DTU_2020_1001157_1_SI_ALB_TIR_016]|uniref:thioredoxin family protein n=1 Tax=Domibacillus sp. DTU_2020_1001157_1_SI_ALB_TIR_016 TaxID=3077789 RepID=UPI0028ED502F|nr:thioredoxin family protein [Domibacillus sp. DTU_2020_1001157_1_SI_ALB_TIR_016]WNS80201.1 thioredoxin family protein [Domibacillus sp. DTU_2020_1001157_1_SI_ALB_TIR_016]